MEAQINLLFRGGAFGRELGLDKVTGVIQANLALPVTYLCVAGVCNPVL